MSLISERTIENKLAHHVQRTIWGEVLDRVSIGEKMEFFEGKLLHLPKAISLDLVRVGSEIEGILAPSLLRVLQISEPDDTAPASEDTAAAGGWCSFFTGDLKLISHGLLPDLITGEGKPINSVGQLSEWIRNSVRMDQIVEAVFPLEARQHVLIDEVNLWASKLVRRLENPKTKKPSVELDLSDEFRLKASIAVAGDLRFQCTKKFLKATNGNAADDLKRFTDDEIWKDLNDTRDFLFDQAGITPKSRELLQTEGLLWAQYTGPYTSSLKMNHILDEDVQTVVFSEPIQHATPSLPNDEELREEVKKVFAKTFDGDNAFGKRGGINQNVGQAAMIPCFSMRGPLNPVTNTEFKPSQRVISTTKGSRQQCTAADVPNIENWKCFLEKLDPNVVPERLCDSEIFNWAANLLSSHPESIASMLGLVDIVKGDPNSSKAKLAISGNLEALKDQIAATLKKTFTFPGDEE